MKTIRYIVLMAITLALHSCYGFFEEEGDCPTGLYVKFRYDYNLQRADMFSDHVEAVSLYVFDEQGGLVRRYDVANTAVSRPLADRNYTMHITDLPVGRYQLLALAGTPVGTVAADAAAGGAASARARFRITEPTTIDALDILLDRQLQPDGTYMIENNGLPLDTLWHGQHTETFRTGKPHLVEVLPWDADYDTAAYDTITFVRDTKKINISLRELADPTKMDIKDFDLRITDRNSHLLWDNSVDEADVVTYTPHAVWNTDDKTAPEAAKSRAGGVGKIGHVDFMTSRLVYHADPEDDAKLTVTSKETGKEIINVNLMDLLCRLGTSEDAKYSPQEFLDRCYDYRMTFYLSEGELKYVDIDIPVNLNVLSWRVVFKSAAL